MVTSTEGKALSRPFLTRILKSLVATPSVNPGDFEEAMTKRVAEWLEPTPLEVTFVESLPGRNSVAAVLHGTGDGPRLVLNGHLDTVPIDDAELWTVDPFEGTVSDGHLYGRGACDMKAGLAAQIAVAHHLAGHADRLKGSLILHFAVGEERAEPGTLSLLKAGFVGDYGITTEPTALGVATATRGAAYFEIRIKGRSIHASRAHLGLNPIALLPAVLDVIEDYERGMGERTHRLCGVGTCTATIVRAGVAENAVPDLCEIVVDRRLIPGESVGGERRALAECLESIHVDSPEYELEISDYRNPYESAEIDEGSLFAQGILEAVEDVTGKPGRLYGAPFCSDVRNLVNDAGMEAVTFGPGNVSETHCVDERVSLEQVEDSARVIAKVAEDLLLA